MEHLFAAIEGALPSIASFMVIAVITFIFNKLRKGKFSISQFLKDHQKSIKLQEENTKDIKELKNEVEELRRENTDIKSVLRNDTKSHIVSVYERCVDKGYITPMELETVNRLNDSYHNTLNGNTYIHVIVHQMNHDMPLKGTEIPEH